MKVRDGMVTDLVTASPWETAAEVARKMRDCKVGCVLISNEGKLLGLITDREIALVVYEPEAEIVRMIFIWYVRGDGDEGHRERDQVHEQKSPAEHADHLLHGRVAAAAGRRVAGRVPGQDRRHGPRRHARGLPGRRPGWFRRCS